MNTLRQAVHEYLSMRRNLGFKLREAGKGLLDFVTFMEQHRAPYITQFLADPMFCPMPEISVAAGGKVFRAFGHIASAVNH